MTDPEVTNQSAPVVVPPPAKRNHGKHAAQIRKQNMQQLYEDATNASGSVHKDIQVRAREHLGERWQKKVKQSSITLTEMAISLTMEAIKTADMIIANATGEYGPDHRMTALQQKIAAVESLQKLSTNLVKVGESIEREKNERIAASKGHTHAPPLFGGATLNVYPAAPPIALSEPVQDAEVE